MAAMPVPIGIAAAGGSYVGGVISDTTITVYEAVKQIEEEIGAEVYLTYKGRPLDETADSLEEWGIEESDELVAHFKLLGGAKKKKKKIYTKPKKAKHKKKKVKLAVLKCYKVDQNLNIHRLRKECPKCHSGVFMAAHANRTTCGRCGMAYVRKPEETAEAS
eukprot:GHVU01030546.1.p1 GENE.GHVU01030546.1~~GHVU01030546.1.p1  ORF type:complete len:169 (-),score=28.74 GHVU01030546.1:211-696(-)